jgi:hypothetical protein
MENKIDEINKELKSEPEGTFKLFHGSNIGVAEDINQHINNHNEINQRISNAVQAGCYIEVISLRLQVIDYWLRIFVVNQSPEENREREFGRLLKQCYELGLNKNKKLYDNLKTFNSNRIKAIHGYVIGQISYEKLSEVVDYSRSLMNETTIFVLENTGEIITDIEGRYFNVGDNIMNVRAAKMLLEQ